MKTPCGKEFIDCLQPCGTDEYEACKYGEECDRLADLIEEEIRCGKRVVGEHIVYT